ncbi:hypothetical protein MAPG_02944 [Magnaporthiopsis poae ATCC 64411]|uniref:Uncharacterized protein n=1 Tax=Magnaporthiopsis poae (strain ATCC 64411 / 73-15) TaxID=644358 RepID=A0A0C4DSQ6_MAGP6|nr:hypothetical protein MAPG_02944 [Magnaporthiopsis poae ATCC 64411]
MLGSSQWWLLDVISEPLRRDVAPTAGFARFSRPTIVASSIYWSGPRTKMAEKREQTPPQGVYVLMLSHALTGHITHFLRIGRFLLSRGWPVGLLGSTPHRARIEAAGIERIAWSGIGVDLATERPSPEQVKKGVLDVLTETRYRDRVLAMQKEAAGFSLADLVDSEVRNLATDRA